MSNQHHLVKGTKPYHYYFFRCIIPKDLRSILGKSQIRISLKNSDYCYSKKEERRRNERIMSRCFIWFPNWLVLGEPNK